MYATAQRREILRPTEWELAQKLKLTSQKRQSEGPSFPWIAGFTQGKLEELSSEKLNRFSPPHPPRYLESGP